MLALILSAGFGPPAYANSSCFLQIEGRPALSVSRVPYHAVALDIMLKSSLQLSRTHAQGRRFMAPDTLDQTEISHIAERNFREAAELILSRAHELEINLPTAVLLNRVLTNGLVPEEKRGRYDYRNVSGTLFEVDSFIGSRPMDFYITWLNSEHARDLQLSSPVEFAEIVHNSIVSLDSFPDGNGRLSRLMADLVLLRAGMAPALYTSTEDYFARGNPRSNVSRRERKVYFREAVARGQQRLGFLLPPQVHPAPVWPWLRAAGQ